MSSRIGDILVDAGKLQAAQLERALRVQEESDERLGNLLVQLGFVAERDLAGIEHALDGGIHFVLDTGVLSLQVNKWDHNSFL